MSVRAYFDHNSLFNSSGENKSSIIIGVLAYQIDAPWRSVDVSSLTIKMLDKAASYEIYFHVFGF